jgi:hypothetical protein
MRKEASFAVSDRITLTLEEGAMCTLSFALIARG